MKNGKRRNSSHFKQTIPNLAFATPFSVLHSPFSILHSPFSILHFSFLSFVSWCLRGQKSGLGVNGFAEVLRDLSQFLIEQFGSIRLQIQSQQRLRA